MGVTWLITLREGGQNRPWVLVALMYERVKLRNSGKIGLFHFFLSLHYQNNRFENISIFYLPLFNLVAKKPILR
jgi:hypothetical protein